MSSRLFLGGAAAAAAGYMVYEYQQQHERQRQTAGPIRGGTAPVASHVTKQNAAEREAEQQRQDTTRWIADKAEFGHAKATEMANEFQNKAAEQKEQVSQDAATGWKRIKSGLTEDTRSVKDALLGAQDSQGKVVPQKGGDDRSAKDGSKSIFNWGFNEAERAKAIAIGDYDRANKELSAAQENWDTSKKGVFDSGDAALREKVDELKKTLADKKRKLEDASQHYASYTRDNFNDISNKLDAQDEKIRKEGGFFKWLTRSPPAEEDKKKAHGKDEAESKQASTAVSPDQLAANSLGGFGENAYFFSKEQIDDQLRNKQIGPSEAQRRLDELKKIKKEGWMQYAKDPESEERIAKNAYKGVEGWGESAAEFAHEELEDAHRRFQKRIESRSDAAKAMDEAAARVQAAKKRVESTGSSWWQSGKDKTDQLHEKAKADFDQAVKDYDGAKETFNNWKDKATGKFWSSADDRVRAMRRKELERDDETLQEQLLEE